MVEECVHLFPDGRKCRRIPKRGQKLCPAHRLQRRRRAPLEENEAFLREMFAFVDNLNAMESADLLYATTGFLADIHLLIDRCASRAHRIAFSRATAAVAIVADRLEELARGLRQPPAPQSLTPAEPYLPAPSQPLSSEAKARIQRAEAVLNSGRVLTPQELSRICDDMIGTLKSDAETTSTFN